MYSRGRWLFDNGGGGDGFFRPARALLYKW